MEKLRKIQKQLKNAVWYFGGTAATAVLGLISTPLLTRVLSTEVYAQYGLTFSFTTLLATFIYLGQDEAFMRYFEVRGESFGKFLFRCMRIPLLLCLVAAVLVMEPSQTILKWIYGSKVSRMAAFLLVLYTVIFVLQRFLMLTARMEERAANYSLSNIATKAFFLIAIAGMLASGMTLSLEAVILALICGVWFALLINVIAVARIKHVQKAKRKSVSAKEMFLFGIPFAFSSTLFFAVPLLEKMLIRRGTDWETLGIYTAAAIFITVMNMIKTTVNSMWIPYVYKNYQNEQKFKPVFYNVGIAMAFLIACILAGTILTRRWLVLILDKAYFDSFIIAPAIVCGACFDSLTAIYSIGINIRKKTVYHTLIPVIQMIISCILLVTGLPVMGLRATGLAYLVSISVSRSVQIVIALKYYDTGRRNYKLVFLMGMCVAAAFFSLFYTSMRFDIICTVLLLVLSGIAVCSEILKIIRKVLEGGMSYENGD